MHDACEENLSQHAFVIYSNSKATPKLKNTACHYFEERMYGARCKSAARRRLYVHNDVLCKEKFALNLHQAGYRHEVSQLEVEALPSQAVAWCLSHCSHPLTCP